MTKPLSEPVTCAACKRKFHRTRSHCVVSALGHPTADVCSNTCYEQERHRLAKLGLLPRPTAKGRVA